MAEVLKKSRKSNFSPEEVDVLVTTVGRNYDVLYGEFSKRAASKNARHHAWLDVTKEVNQVSLEKRTLQEVKNKWKKCQHLYRSDDFLDVSDEFVIPTVWEPLTTIEDEDSMPLEQRLKTPLQDQDAPLHSQPLSPTKLKVTRQTSKPSQSSPRVPTPPPPIEEVCLRWNSHHSNMQNSFPSLLLKEQFVDATLVAEGQTLKCHRVILSSCSPYFEDVLSSISPYQHPVLFMKDVPFWILKSLCDFMYAGEIHILQNKLEELLAIAETLKIKGLAEKSSDGSNHESNMEPLLKIIKEEKKDERDVKDKRKPMLPADMPVLKSAKLTKATQLTEMPVLKSAKGTKAGGVAKKSPIEKKTGTSETVTKEHGGFLDPLDLLEPVYEELTNESKLMATPTKAKESRPVPVRKSVQKRIRKRKVPDERDEMTKTETVEKKLEKTFNILDPMNLLQPIYEELANINKEETPPVFKPVAVKRTLPKKFKKRKMSELREESPPPVISKKGTRSRPNRKMPKYYHSQLSPKMMETVESTIVREPHTDQADPLLQPEDIKAEPLDVEDDALEIEDNGVGFTDQEMALQEEALGDYDHPENYTDVSVDGNRSDCPVFKKISLLPQPVITDVHSVAEKNDDTLKIIDVADLKNPEVPEAADAELSTDPLSINANTSGTITISNVQSVAESEKDEKNGNSCNELGLFRISDVITHKEGVKSTEAETNEMGFQITNITSGTEALKSTLNVEKAICKEMEFQITDVVSELDKNKENENKFGELALQISDVSGGDDEIPASKLGEGCRSNVDFRITSIESLRKESSDDIKFQTVVVSEAEELNSHDLEKCGANLEKAEMKDTGADDNGEVEFDIESPVKDFDTRGVDNGSTIDKILIHSCEMEGNEPAATSKAVREEEDEKMDQDEIGECSELFPKNVLVANFTVDLDGSLQSENIVHDPIRANFLGSRCGRVKDESSCLGTLSSQDYQTEDSESGGQVPSETDAFEMGANSLFDEDMDQSDANPLDLSTHIDHSSTEDNFNFNEPGFHIARVISALNEEHLLTERSDFGRRQIGASGEPGCDISERYSVASNNDLEAIVNDLTKIVGDPQGIGTVSNVAAAVLNNDDACMMESLENLLEK